MYFSTTKRFCRWCGKIYQPKKAIDRDGFCHKKCKAALYRALKKYATNVTLQGKTISKIGYARKRGQRKKVLTKT